MVDVGFVIWSLQKKSGWFPVGVSGVLLVFLRGVLEKTVYRSVVFDG
jgi:hypothetical protein